MSAEPTIFDRILDGEIPCHRVYEDDHVLAFLDINPLAPGHTLVIPKVEIDQWTDLEPELVAHLMDVAHTVARAQKSVVPCERVGLMIAGFEVPHTHIHVVPLASMANLDFRNADTSPKADELDAMADKLRDAIAAS